MAAAPATGWLSGGGAECLALPCPAQNRLHQAASFGIWRSTNRKYRWLRAPATKILKYIKDFMAEHNARLSTFQILVNTWSTFDEPPIDGADNRRRRHPSLRKILPKPVHLMHPLVQDRHDANITVRQPPPVHEMMRVPEVKAVDGELCRDRTRRRAPRSCRMLQRDR